MRDGLSLSCYPGLKFAACSALYQLHLVKASTARAFVPRDLRLVEAFGYTLGGMFLARYHDSPAGEFDEVRPPPPPPPPVS